MTRKNTTDNNQSQTPVAPTRIRANSPRQTPYSIEPTVNDTESMIDNSEKVTLVTETENDNTKK
ncbi:hypothetical protein [Candidatus Enterovibrio escicola]|uniref:hypothetical protein n=1 Tax=Candidatus Enterovibrio escicola TaxID=1927127 RepID=UPI0016812871|nr:hypothetical protein [Candidatus Enterovibrio escacola]